MVEFGYIFPEVSPSVPFSECYTTLFHFCTGSIGITERLRKFLKRHRRPATKPTRRKVSVARAREACGPTPVHPRYLVHAGRDYLGRCAGEAGSAGGREALHQEVAGCGVMPVCSVAGSGSLVTIKVYSHHYRCLTRQANRRYYP